MGVGMIPRLSLAISVVLICIGCSANERGITSDGAGLGPATQFTGTLRAGIVAIGGEHTGWVLQGDGQSGGIEVDVSAVANEARALEGRRVTVRGRMSEKNYRE